MKRYAPWIILATWPLIVIAGTNRLVNVRPGQIVRPAHMNQFRDALSENVMPRNSSGTVTDLAGDAGTGTRRWDELFANSIHIGTPGQVVLSNPGLQGEDFASIPKAALYLPGQILSSSSSTQSISSTSFTDVSNNSVVVTTSGNPVRIMWSPDNTGIGAYRSGAQAISGPANAITFLRVLRNGSEIVQYKVGGGGLNAVYSSPSVVDYTESVSAGTYTYKIQARLNNGQTGNAAVETTALLAYEE